MAENELEEVVGDVPEIPPEEPPPDAPPVDEPPDAATLKAEIEALEQQKKDAEAAALKWRKEKAQARKDFFQDRQQPPQPETPPAPAETAKPDPDSFDDYNLYVDALTDWKVEQKKQSWDRAETEKAQSTQHQAKMAALQEKINDGFNKYVDFEDVALSETVPITPMVTEVLAEMDNPADVAYYLGKNQTEAIKISRMTPLAAAGALAKIESKIAGTTPAQPKKTSNAPPPIKPVSSGGSAAVTKDPDKMTQKEFESWMENRGAPRY